METWQLLKTRVELPFSPANGHLLKSHVLFSYCSGLFPLQHSELDMSSSTADFKKKSFSTQNFLEEGDELHDRDDNTLSGSR